MKTYKLLSLGLLVWGFSSCQDGLDKDVSVAGVTVTPNENVVCEGVTVNAKKGEPIVFNFSGEPDNIVFFSGETGHNFDYRKRTTIDASQIVSSKLTVDITPQYSGGYDNLFSMYMSEEFPGLYKNDFAGDCQLLKDFTGWTDWVKQEDLPINANTPVSSEMDMMPYLGKTLTLAIHVHPHDESLQQPKLNFSQVKITNELRNGSTIVLYASSMGFTPVNVWSADLSSVEMDSNLSKNNGYYDSSNKLIESALWYGTVTNNIWGMWNLSNASTGSFYVHSVVQGKGLRESWLVSDYLVINACDPDTGVTLKKMSNRLSSYEYTYNEVGTYKATFLMTNSNYKHEDSKVVTMVINVK